MATGSTLIVQCLAPDWRYQSEAVAVNVPAAKGRRGILPEQASELIVLQPGVIDIYVSASEPQRFSIESGLCHIYAHQGATMRVITAPSLTKAPQRFE